MSCLGNIIWFIFGGFWGGLGWTLIGMLWCVTIIGIPIGLQCFKFAKLSFWPFGKEVVYEGGGFSCLINVLWLIFGGIELAITHCISGLLLCLTIVGIPFAKQSFKLARLALMPIGARIVTVY